MKINAKLIIICILCIANYTFIKQSFFFLLSYYLRWLLNSLFFFLLPMVITRSRQLSTATAPVVADHRQQPNVLF